MKGSAKKMAGRFQELASSLEEALGLGGEKTARFVEELSKKMAPVLDSLETTVMVTKSIPFKLIRSAFLEYFRQTAKEAGLSWPGLQASARELAGLLREWFQPQAFGAFLMGIGQYYFSKKGEEEVDDMGMDPSAVESVRPLFEFLYKDYWRVSVQGVQNIPAKGRCLLVANHSGMLPYDGGIITAACLNEHPAGRRVRFLIEDFVYHFPFLGTFMNRLGAVRACQENAVWLLKKGELVLVFPEGVKGLGKLYAERYQLKRFGRGGVIKLAIKTQTPIVPVAVIGAEEIHPIIWKSGVLAKAMGIPYLPVTPTFPWLGPLGLIPLPTKWKIRFGKPVSFDKYSPSQAEDGLLVQALTEKIRGKIQKMVDRELIKRKSVWGG